MVYVAYKVHYCQWTGPDKQINKIWLLFLLSWCKFLNQFKIIMVAVGVRFRFRVRIRIRNLQSNSGILHRHWVRLYRKQRPKTLKMKIPKKVPHFTLWYSQYSYTVLLYSKWHKLGAFVFGVLGLRFRYNPLGAIIILRCRFPFINLLLCHTYSIVSDQ